MPRPKGFDPDRVLDAAMDAFWRRGFSATSAQDLVDGTGLGRGSLYNAFVSKERLFQEALRRYEDVWTARQEAILDGAEPIRDRIRQVLMTVVDEETAAREDGRRGCLAVNTAIELAGVDDEVTAQVRHTFVRVEEALHGALSRARRDGAISGEPRALARFVLNSLYGLRVLGKTADRAALVGIVETTLSVL